jgi:hypothetical protein
MMLCLRSDTSIPSHVMPIWAMHRIWLLNEVVPICAWCRKLVSIHKKLRSDHITVSNGSYRQLNWSGEAAHMYTGPAVNMKMKLRDGLIHAVMPRNLFGQTDALLNRIHVVDMGSVGYYEHSVVYKENVHVVPLKRFVQDEKDEPASTMDTFVPLGFQNLDPAENVGLWTYIIKTMKRIDVQHSTKYVIFKIDSNIFQRWMKVCTTAHMYHMHVMPRWA